MENYKPYINALRQCAKEHENDITPFAYIRVSDLCKDTANLLETLEQKSRKWRWIEHPHEWGDNWQYSQYECSCCHDWAYEDTDYCPNCGVEMEEVEV